MANIHTWTMARSLDTTDIPSCAIVMPLIGYIVRRWIVAG